MNQVGTTHNSITLFLDSQSNAIGSKIMLKHHDGRIQYRELIANNGAAQNERLVHFGIGLDASVEQITIEWEDHTVTSFSSVQSGRYHATKDRLEKLP